MSIDLGIKSFKSNVFQDITPNVKTGQKRNFEPVKVDTFETRTASKKVNPNKKLLIGAAVIGAVILGAVIFKKNISGMIKPLKNAMPKEAAPLQPSKTTEKLIQNAKEFLIDDVKKTGVPAANGICFYGPDSIGKEQALGGFLDTLKKAGYKIEHTPRESEAPIPEIGAAIQKCMREAEERFKTTKQRTAIVIRDLDKIAPDRVLANKRGVFGALTTIQDCRKRGYVWISEAVDLRKIDPALLRGGRMDHHIIVTPSLQDSKSVWKEYAELVKGFREGPKKDILLKEAKEVIDRKGK